MNPQKNDPFIIEEGHDVEIDQELLAFIWGMAALFTCKIPPHVLIKFPKKDIQSLKKLSLFLGKHEDDYFLSNNLIEQVPNEDIVNFKYEDLIIENFVGRWFKLSEKKPIDQSYILASLYEGFPAVLRVMKDKFYIVIPGKSNKENKDIYVEVTKGLKYWTFLPNHIQAFD